MAGLLVALGCRPGWATRTVRELAPALVHYPWLGVRTFEADPFALALVQHRDVEAPVWHVERTPQVVVFGEYVHSAGERPGLTLAAHAEAGRWAELRNGNGLYNLCAWDAGKGRLVVANDATGALLLFRARYREGWLWCSEPGALPRAGRLDAAGLRSLACIGYQADERTLDDEIVALPPATTDVMRVTGERIALERHTGIAPDSGDGEGFEAAYAELVRDAVRARLPGVGPLDLPLTGGLDSRLLLGETLAAGHPVRTFTLAAGPARDLSLARRVAAAARVDHRTLTAEAGTVRLHGALLRGALHTTSDWHAAERLAVCGAARPGQPLLLGFLGGTLAGAFVDRRGAAAGRARMRAQALAPYGGCLDARGLAWSDPPAGGDADTPAELVENLYGRQRRYTSYLVRLAWNFGRPICPFADVRLVRRALAARRQELTGQRARVHALRQRHPRLARIATTDDAMPLGPASPRLLRTAVRRTRVVPRLAALLPSVRSGFDFDGLGPLAAECRAEIPDQAATKLLEDLPPMAALALAPVLIGAGPDDSAAALELVRTTIGGR